MNSTAELGGMAELRRAFDETFALPAVRPAEDCEPMIAIRVAGQALALRALEIAALVKRNRILPVPSCVPELLGLAGGRGVLVAVYDLAPFVGLSRCAGEPQWLAIAKGEPQLALAFDEIEGLVEVGRTSVYADSAAPSPRHVRQLAQIGPGTRAVVDITAIMATIRAKAGSTGPAQE